MNYRRKRVDWDAEIKKTEKIKRKGLLMSAFSFAGACAFVFGISRYTGVEFQLMDQLEISMMVKLKQLMQQSLENSKELWNGQINSEN